MKTRIKKESLTPSSVKVFSTFTSCEEQEVLKKRRDTLKELDALIASKKEPEFAYVRIFGKEMYLSMEDIKKANLKWYIK